MIFHLELQVNPPRGVQLFIYTWNDLGQELLTQLFLFTNLLRTYYFQGIVLGIRGARMERTDCALRSRV